MPDTKTKILIIDDDDVDRMTIKRALMLAGINADIFTATDIETGTSLAFEEEFACIFLDYNLPGNNGFDFLENYRSKNGKSHVILVTSHGDENLAAEAIKKGANEFLTKNKITAEYISQLLRFSIDGKKSDHNSDNSIEQSTGTELRLESVIANTSLIIFSIDENGIFNLFKGRGIENLQLSVETILGKSIFETADLLPIQPGDYKNALFNNNFHASVEMNERFYEIHYMPVTDNENKPVGMNGVVMDITTLKKNEQELKNSLVISEETQKIKESFLANMSHEIRTPIHAIMNLTDILLKTEVSPEQHKFLDAIKKSADNLLVIINDILDLSKIEAQKMTFENTPFNLRDVIHSVIEIFNPRAQEKKLKLILNYNEDLPDFINGDSVRLSQVINNLISNAIKFTHDGEVKMDVYAEEKNEKFCLVAFKISDTGIGIPQHKLSSIFDSFSQASDDITRKYGGTGLGLNICKQLVELQGGMISVESTPNRGSVFIFRLAFENIVPEDNISTSITQNSTELVFNKELKILVVEDNDINRMVINIMMRDWKFKTDNAVNGSVAIDMIEQNNYDIVLMDIEMPGLNGYQTTQHIRKNLPAPKNAIPILAMTAHANSSEKEKCLNAGMNDYVSKPFDAEELRSKIIALCTPVPAIENESKADVTETSNERLTNLTFLRQLADNNETFFKDFISLFLENAPQTLADLESSLEKKDWNGVRQAAHKIKPTLSYLGMKDAHQAAVIAEEYAKDRKNLNEIPALAEKIKNACNKAYTELEKELKEISI
jgi:signal transduction histidine kinase/DNA-binding response OmpR family regulator